MVEVLHAPFSITEWERYRLEEKRTAIRDEVTSVLHVLYTDENISILSTRYPTRKYTYETIKITNQCNTLLDPPHPSNTHQQEKKQQ
jgi:hypothetical protein